MRMIKLYELFDKNGDIKDKYSYCGYTEVIDGTLIKEQIIDILDYKDSFYISKKPNSFGEADYNLYFRPRILFAKHQDYFNYVNLADILIVDFDNVNDLKFILLYCIKKLMKQLNEKYYDLLPSEYKLLLEIDE